MDTVGLHPVIENGRVVYGAPLVPRIAVLMLAALMVLAMAVILLVLINGAMVMA